MFVWYLGHDIHPKQMLRPKKNLPTCHLRNYQLTDHEKKAQGTVEEDK